MFLVLHNIINFNIICIIIVMPKLKFSGSGVVKNADYHYCCQSFNHLTALSSVGWITAQGACETSQYVFASMSGGCFGVLKFSPIPTYMGKTIIKGI